MRKAKKQNIWEKIKMPPFFQLGNGGKGQICQKKKLLSGDGPKKPVFQTEKNLFICLI